MPSKQSSRASHKSHDPVKIGRVLAPLPDPRPEETLPDRPEPIDVTAALKALVWEVTYLLTCSTDQFATFLESFDKCLRRMLEIEPSIQTFRYEWARIVRARLGLAEVTMNGRACSSGHQGVYEYCRQVIFTTWAAIDPVAILADWPKRPAFNREQARERWSAIQSALKNIEAGNPTDLYPQLDAELGALLGGNKQSHAIPPEFRTKPIGKGKAACLLGQNSGSSGVQWLNNCIADGTIICEKHSRQKYVFDIRQFPATSHNQLRPSHSN